MKKIVRFMKLKQQISIQEGIILLITLTTLSTLAIQNIFPIQLLVCFSLGILITHLYHTSIHKKSEIDLLRYEKRLTETQNVLLDLISYTTKKS